MNSKLLLATTALAVVIVSGCGATLRNPIIIDPAGSTPAAESTPATAAPKPATPSQPTPAPAPKPSGTTPNQPPATGGCTKHGTKAWNQPNPVSGQAEVIGGLEEPCGVTFQTWDGSATRYIVGVPPYCFVRMTGNSGGTGWYFDWNRNPRQNLEKQARELQERDGPLKTVIALLPDQAFPLAVDFRCKTVVLPATSAPAQPAAPAPQPAAQTGDCSGTTYTGPAILEGPGPGGNGLLVKLNAGQTRLAVGITNCWPLDSQAALDAGFSDHEGKWRTKAPRGVVEGK